MRAHGLKVQKMLIHNRLQFSFLPLRRMFRRATDATFPSACITPEPVRLHSILRVRDLGTGHVPGASRTQTDDGFMLKGLDKRIRSRHRFPRSEILRTTTGGCPYSTVIVGDGPRAVPATYQVTLSARPTCPA